MPITTATESTSNQEAISPVAPHKSTLDSNDFLKLLSTQFQAQDPMNPMEDTAFIAQMAQFSALDQNQQLVTEMGLLREEQGRLAATSYIGRSVTLDDGDDGVVTGIVTAVDASGDTPQLVVGDKSWPFSAVLRVEPDPSPTFTPLPSDPEPSS
jgi:flagellar basal-body rod modification protein FlgD